MIYQVWGIERGEKPPQILLMSFKLATDAEASYAADYAAESLRNAGATDVKVVPVPESDERKRLVEEYEGLLAEKELADQMGQPFSVTRRRRMEELYKQLYDEMPG